MVANDRTTSIGASDAAAALGVCPWKSPFQLWAEKTGIAEPPDLDAVECVEWGNRLEPVIARAYADRTGRKIDYNDKATPMLHPDRPFISATLDAAQTDTDKGIGSLEIKTAGYWAGKSWLDGEAPLHYQVQLQHQLAVTGMPWGTLCVLIGGQKMIWFDVERNEPFIEAMIDKLSFFWTQVLDKIPPDPDGSIATRDVLRRLYPKDDGTIIALPPESVGWDERLFAAKQRVKDDKAIVDEYENKFRHALGTATEGVLPGGKSYTFKSQHRKGYEVQPGSFRVLRRRS